MNKKLIRLTEQDLHRIVKESVNKVLNEELPKKDWGSVNIAYSGKVGKNEWNNGFQGYFVCTPNDGVKYCSTKREAIAIVKQFYQGEDRDYVITMEIEGNRLSSLEFAKKIDTVFNNYSNIVFVIGGSYGLSDSVKNRSNFRLSFSDLTFPHQLFRVMLLEQIYRVFKINNNETYHK